MERASLLLECVRLKESKTHNAKKPAKNKKKRDPCCLKKLVKQNFFKQPIFNSTNEGSGIVVDSLDYYPWFSFAVLRMFFLVR